MKPDAKLAWALLLALVVFACAAHAAQEPEATAPAVAQQTAERSDVARFRERAEAALASNGAQKAYWGVLVVDAETGQTLYSLNADRYFKAASNMKLFTTVMALAMLVLEFRTRTTH